MRKLFAIVPLGLCLLLLAGCSSTYVMTLNNGSRIATRGRPKMKDGVYVYKDINGEMRYENPGRVRAIEPASMVDEKKSFFIQ